MHEDIDPIGTWGMVCVNGRLMEASEASVSALDRGLLYGDGIFETVRVYGGKPFMLDAHLARMAEGCAVLHLPSPDVVAIRKWAERVLQANRLDGDAYLRITMTRGATGRLWYDLGSGSPTVIVIARPYTPPKYDDGIRIMVSSFRSDESSPLSRTKHTGILWKILARAEAKRSGYDDALLLNTKGHISEGTSANVFWVRDGRLFTPSLDSGILAGITRGLVIKIVAERGICVEEGFFGLDDLLSAEEAFLTSSTSEIVFIRSAGGKEFGTSPGGLTRKIAEWYRELTTAEQ